MKQVLLTICCIGLLAAASLEICWPSARKNTNDQPHLAGPRENIILSAEKFSAAEIKVANAMQRKLRSQRIVPGHVEYNATRHVQVKSPFDGLIRRIEIKVGDRVTEGQVLAVVDSPELGERRADVHLRETDLQQAEKTHAWWHTIQDNLDELLARLKRPQEISQLEKEFADKVLGDYRQQIITSYSRMQVAEKQNQKIELVRKNEPGAMSVKSELDARATRDTTAAEYAAACEQAMFDVKQKHFAAESAMQDCQRRLAVTKQRLRNLVNEPNEVSLDLGTDESPCSWPVKAPFAATVEEVLMAPKERIQTAEVFFQIADTTRLWVQADIRERDWSALAVSAGQTISVQTAALPGQTLEATVSFVGRIVSQETRAVTLTAEIDNQDGKLRPGLFVRVLIPDGEPRECLVVPQTSVTSNDGRTFVFVETGPRTYHIRDVTTGLSVDPWVEIKSGLQPDDRVVTSGAAILKAELLLESED